MTRNHRFSEFMRSLGRYRRPVPGEELLTDGGKATVLRVIPYEDAVEEMRLGGVPEGEIERFDLRIENFLGKKGRYFECELTLQDGEVERIDWSEYLAIKNKRKG